MNFAHHLAWRHDPVIEGRLLHHGVNWIVTYVNLSLVEGDEPRWSRVAEYARQMKRGTEFPMPVVIKQEHGYTILSGNHRINAAVALNASEVPCYVVCWVDADEIERRLNESIGL